MKEICNYSIILLFRSSPWLGSSRFLRLTSSKARTQAKIPLSCFKVPSADHLHPESLNCVVDSDSSSKGDKSNDKYIDYRFYLISLTFDLKISVQNLFSFVFHCETGFASRIETSKTFFSAKPILSFINLTFIR